MAPGLLLIDNGHQQMYLPVFCADRELVHVVLCDAMNEWSGKEQQSRRNSAVAFFGIADDLGRERFGCEGCFIGPEAVSALGCGNEEDAVSRAGYVFAADFEGKQIVTVK